MSIECFYEDSTRLYYNTIPVSLRWSPEVSVKQIRVQHIRQTSTVNLRKRFSKYPLLDPYIMIAHPPMHEKLTRSLLAIGNSWNTSLTHFISLSLSITHTGITRLFLYIRHFIKNPYWASHFSFSIMQLLNIWF